VGRNSLSEEADLRFAVDVSRRGIHKIHHGSLLLNHGMPRIMRPQCSNGPQLEKITSVIFEDIESATGGSEAELY